jgi:drug/metabolite transporter (DMT)-like permease
MLAAGVTVGIYWWVTGGATNWHTMGPRAYPAVIGAGVLGAAGPVCYLLATRHGLLVVTAVLAGLYPGVTVGLARIVLHERSRRIQLIGLILAAIAVTAITIG